MNQIGFAPTSGLCDQLLDTIGFVVFCKYMNKTPLLEWCKDTVHFKQPWGIANFDEQLFDFSSYISLVNKIPPNISRLYSRNTGASLSVLKLHELTHAPVEDIIKVFKETAINLVKPSELITFKEELSKCIGIHLRRTDKIKNKTDKIDRRHETSLDEYSQILERLKECVKALIQNSDKHEIWYFICSEDKPFKEQFINDISRITYELKKQPKFYIPDYPNLPGAEAVVDMFSLSKCTCILQGIKYSTFSILANMIGDNILYNFGNHDTLSLIHLWKPFLKLINNGIYVKYDIASMEKVNKTISSVILTNPQRLVQQNSFNKYMPAGMQKF
jgi:hypothetical protein